MREFEWLILISLAPVFLGLFLPAQRRPAWLAYMPYAATVWILLHLVFEGWRWQMIPAYALTAFLLAMPVISPHCPTAAARIAGLGRRCAALRLAGALAALLMLVLAAALPAALPVFQLPPPSGPYPVGTVSLAYTDETRRGIFSPDPNEPRRLMLQVWYPAEPAPGRAPAPYLREGPDLLDYWSLIPTHARSGAPAAGQQARYPVILYAHCYACLVNESTRLMEDLASHGYIVVSIAHPYEEVATVYPEGPPLTGDFKRMSAVRHQFPMPEFYAAMRAASDLGKKQTLFRDYLAQAPLIEQSARVWTEDNRFVLDRLVELDAAGRGPLAGKFDFGRVGALGYSLGGAVAGQMCIEDSRVKACANIDCVNFGEMIDRTPAKPLMFISSAAFRGANDAIFGQAPGFAYRITIAGTTHMNFGDLILQAPFLGLLSIPDAWSAAVGIAGPVMGPIRPLRTEEIVQTYTRSFFDRHLKNQAVTLLDKPSGDFPEVDISTR